MENEKTKRVSFASRNFNRFIEIGDCASLSFFLSILSRSILIIISGVVGGSVAKF